MPSSLNATTLIASFLLLACQGRPPEPSFGNRQAPIKVAQPDHAPEQGAQLTTKAQAQAPAARPAPAPRPAAIVRRPTSPDPLEGKFELSAALDGLPGKGALRASITTSMGTLECELFDRKAPNTVANFVGLARGVRPFWDGAKAAWVKRPLYDGTSFHRVIPGFMIQGGDHLGNGSGGVGYNIDDELHPSLKHDRAGLLCMANRGPNTNGGQFFITDAATPHLTAMKTYSIFGACTPTELVSKIARAPKPGGRGEKPASPVVIQSVKIRR